MHKTKFMNNKNIEYNSLLITANDRLSLSQGISLSWKDTKGNISFVSLDKQEGQLLISKVFEDSTDNDGKTRLLSNKLSQILEAISTCYWHAVSVGEQFKVVAFFDSIHVVEDSAMKDEDKKLHRSKITNSQKILSNLKHLAFTLNEQYPTEAFDCVYDFTNANSSKGDLFLNRLDLQCPIWHLELATKDLTTPKSRALELLKGIEHHLLPLGQSDVNMAFKSYEKGITPICNVKRAEICFSYLVNACLGCYSLNQHLQSRHREMLSVILKELKKLKTGFRLNEMNQVIQYSRIEVAQDFTLTSFNNQAYNLIPVQSYLSTQALQKAHQLNETTFYAIVGDKPKNYPLYPFKKNIFQLGIERGEPVKDAITKINTATLAHNYDAGYFWFNNDPLSLLDINYEIDVSNQVLDYPVPSSMQIKGAGSVIHLSMGGAHYASEGIHVADDQWAIVDIDAASFYPKIMINQGFGNQSMYNLSLDVLGVILQNIDPTLYPHSFPSLTNELTNLRNERLQVKDKVGLKAKELQGVPAENQELRTRLSKELFELKSEDSVLKVVLNAISGKLGEKSQSLFDIKASRAMCLEGQMLMIDAIELIAQHLPETKLMYVNTDGFMVKLPRSQVNMLKSLLKNWEMHHNQELEYSEFKTIAFKDALNYIAVKPSGDLKTSGQYSTNELAKSSSMPFIVRDFLQHCILNLHKYASPQDLLLQAKSEFHEFVSNQISLAQGNKSEVNKVLARFAVSRNTDASVAEVKHQSGYKQLLPSVSVVFVKPQSYGAIESITIGGTQWLKNIAEPTKVLLDLKNLKLEWLDLDSYYKYFVHEGLDKLVNPLVHKNLVAKDLIRNEPINHQAVLQSFSAAVSKIHQRVQSKLLGG